MSASGEPCDEQVDELLLEAGSRALHKAIDVGYGSESSGEIKRHLRLRGSWCQTCSFGEMWRREICRVRSGEAVHGWASYAILRIRCAFAFLGQFTSGRVEMVSYTSFVEFYT